MRGEMNSAREWGGSGGPTELPWRRGGEGVGSGAKGVNLLNHENMLSGIGGGWEWSKESALA